MEPAGGRGAIRVRKMRSWRNLRALGTRTSQFEMIRKTASTHTLPSPPITPPGERQQTGEQLGYAHTRPQSQLPDSPVENPFYDDYEEIIEAHLSPSDEERPPSPAEQSYLADASPVEHEQPFQEWPREAIEEMQASRPAEATPAEQATPTIPPPPAPESPVAGTGGMDPMTPDPNSDLVSEIEALLRSSPLRKKQREEEEAARNASNQSTPTQAKIARGAVTAQSPEETPRQVQPPTFTRNLTQTSLGSNSTNDTEFFTPVEGRTPFERPNPLDESLPPPIPPKAARPQTPPTKVAPSIASSHSTPTRPSIPTRTSSLSHSRNGSSETVPTKSYPPTSQRPGAHSRGKSIDSSSVYNDRGRKEPLPGQRQRSSSANAVSDGSRGRGRSRSIDDGPPPIPARRSSVGKTGRPSELLLSLVGKKNEASATGSRRPSLATANVGQKPSDDNEDLELPNASRFSFSSGVEVLGVGEQAEIISADVVRSGSVKEVLVRTGSKGSKPAEFPDPASTSSLSKNGKNKAAQFYQHVPQFSFGEGPNLSLGEETSATGGKGKERAREQDLPAQPQPVMFQLIPPTPAADEAGAGIKQLGFQPIPLALVDEASSSRNPVRQGTPNPLAGVPVVHVHGGSDSTPSVPLPPRLPSVVNEISSTRPSTAPEPLIDFDNTIPSEMPKRPSLSKMPTGFKKSKLSPWWRPKRSYDSRFHNYNDGYDEDHEFYEYRPHTAGVHSDGASSRRKKPRTVSLGKVQVEFVGVKWLRESLKERKEVKRRRKALQDAHFKPAADAGPPRLEVRF
ncbi:hypothetical protein TWF696_003270 [Orbilia brochopaga]|uniref:Uncharacterized protein n=1 Tax=Orbilia brochopaga TaxID=3140254 RepID=A0AAV9TY59_9PEZI